ncbi:cytochrome P450 [Xylariaceae sp. FL1272]|nr:cytochrome P450 [Xylariaceae sp. FL1272]
MDQLSAVRHAMAPLILRKLVYDLRNAFNDSSHRSRYAGVVSAVVLTVLVTDHFRAKRRSLRRLGLPIVKAPSGVHRWDYGTVLDIGSRQYPDRPFLITYSGFDYTVFPQSMWDEFFKHVFFGGWGFLGTDISALHRSIGADLTRAIPIRTQAHYESAKYASQAALGVCPEWKSFRMYWTLQDIVSTTNANALVGPELGHDPRWRRAVQRFPMAIVIGIMISGMSPQILRAVVTWIVFIPAWVLYWYMRILLRPMVSTDMQEYRAALTITEKSQIVQVSPDKKFPMTAWLMARYRFEEQRSHQVAHDFIVASFESTASTSGTFYFIMAELVTRPELCDELPPTNLAELKKLDSVMRECSLALFRRLCTPVQLSVGPELPAGSVISVDIHKVPRSEELWDNPDVFDPWRFLKLRQLPGHEDRHQFTSLGPDTPGWGDGSQACPGRAFAANTLKVVLAYLLMNYEFRIPPGGASPMHFSTLHAPLHLSEIWIKFEAWKNVLSCDHPSAC